MMPNPDGSINTDKHAVEKFNALLTSATNGFHLEDFPVTQDLWEYNDMLLNTSQHRHQALLQVNNGIMQY